MTHDCRLGFPAALAHTEPDDVRVRRTAPPARLSAGEQALRRERDKNATDSLYFPEVKAVGFDFASGPDMTIVALVDSTKKLVQEVCGIPSTSAAPVFKVGDRVRVVGYLRPGSHPYGDGDEGTVVGIDECASDGPEVICNMDKWLPRKMPVRWSISRGNLEHLPQ